MTDRPTVLYVEADDEVTSVVRRLRAADPGRVIVVTPGRSRATSSVVAVRLLARAAEADGRELAVVGDALTRSLAAEAGVRAHPSLDEARRDEAASVAVPEPPRAAISVVRGPHGDDTAPTLAAAVPSGLGEPPRATADDVTRPVPVTRRASSTTGAGRRADRRLLVAILAAAALAVAATAVGAAVLPAATITLEPRSVAVGPISGAVEVPAEERSGSVIASVEAVASATYEVREAATGSVVLFNWTFFPVTVPAGTFVAAGEQAFATQAEVVVPRGRLTPDGRIQAGDVEVAVLAAAVGPAANVPAEAIDTVVNEDVDAQLRGFPENPERRVTNPQPTAGGVDATGPEFTQADVDAALEALRADIAAQVAEALPNEGIVVRTDANEPTIEGVDGLVGKRDVERASLSATLEWRALHADPDEAEALARDRLLADPEAVPADHELLPDSVEIVLGEARAFGSSIVVEATLRAAAAPPIDPDEIRDRVAGLEPVAAMAALADIGVARIELWPGWVAEVPSLDWRVEVRIETPQERQPAGPEPSS